METELTSKVEGEPENRCVVRLKTEYWSNKKGIYTKRSILFMRRKSIGFNVLEEECNHVAAEDSLSNINNLNECEDGLYEAVACNFSRDYESGIIDGYEIKLIAI